MAAPTETAQSEVGVPGESGAHHPWASGRLEALHQALIPRISQWAHPGRGQRLQRICRVSRWGHQRSLQGLGPASIAWDPEEGYDSRNGTVISDDPVVLP